MSNVTLAPRPDVPSSRGFWVMRDLPTAVWLITAIVVSLLHRQIPMPSWLLLHLVFFGAATHAILVWSQHFTAALSRSPVTHRQRTHQNVRLILANAGMLSVFIGVPAGLWLVTLSGSMLAGAAVIWHGISIWQKFRGALPGRFTGTLKYYILSSACLPIGIVLGAWIAHPEAAPGNLKLAHAIINVLGWIGITVAGTLVTLWPTMLRTRASESSVIGAKRALLLLGGGVLIAAIGAMLGFAAIIAFGLAAYATGLIVIGVSLFREAWASAPRTFSTLSAGSALIWWITCIIAVIIAALHASFSGSGVAPVQQAISWAAPFLAAGFVTQVLLGALSYLIPVVIGGGPTPVRIGTTVFNRLANLRVATTNVALFVCMLPVASTARVGASALYLIAVASFIPLLFIALTRQSRAKREGASLPPTLPGESPRSGPISPEGDLTTGRRAGQAVAGLILVLITVAAVSPLNTQLQRPIASIEQIGLLGLASESGAAPSTQLSDDAPRQTVSVEAKDMRFTPSTIEVPSGTHLVIELTNTDATQVHDLIFENGIGGSRLLPGETETIDVGVITANLDGWCSITGHRQMGMTLDIVASGADPVSDQAEDASAHHSQSAVGESAAELIDLTQTPDEGFVPFDAVLEPLPASTGATTHQITLPVTEQMMEVAPGVRQTLWTFGGSAPGPVLHGRVGDTFEITLINDGTIGHSIDFHAGALAPNEPMRTIAPGEELTYTFTATRSGIWMYHCATDPMTAHIANGMYGAVVIEDPELPEVDRSYVLVQGEYYLGPQDGEVDMNRILEERPDLVTFNGYASQYVYEPLPGKVDERVRVWVLDAGPNRASSFHVIGGQFDTVWFEGAYQLNRSTTSGSQALGLQPAQGGFVELTFPEAGDYPFVSHIMIDAERGANGLFHVEP